MVAVDIHQDRPFGSIDVDGKALCEAVAHGLLTSFVELLTLRPRQIRDDVPRDAYGAIFDNHSDSFDVHIVVLERKST
jgi:hypothetical protein